MRGVRGVSLLPEKLQRAQEETRSHFPAHDVRPLIDQEREVAVALHPLCEHRVDDRLRCGSNDQGLFELFSASVRDDCGLRREALHVRRLAMEKALGNEQREIGVAVSRLLEHVIEGALHSLPDAVAIWSNDHAAADGRIVGELRAEHDLVVPGAEIFRTRCELLLVCHVLGSETKSGTMTRERD